VLIAKLFIFELNSLVIHATMLRPIANKFAFFAFSTQTKIPEIKIPAYTDIDIQIYVLWF